AEYAKYRPTIKIPENEIKKINDSIGLHPALGGLANLLEEQAVCVVQGVGYPNPSQSHFRSMDIWQAASTADSLTEGWLGRALKSTQSPAFHVAAPNEISWLALAGAPARVPSITALGDFTLKTAAASAPDKQQQKAIIEGAAMPDMMPTRSPGLLD